MLPRLVASKQKKKQKTQNLDLLGLFSDSLNLFKNCIKFFKIF